MSNIIFLLYNHKFFKIKKGFNELIKNILNSILWIKMVIYMDFSNKELGRWGEKKACNYLIKNNYIIIEKNYRTRIGEIDIIVKKDEKIIFVEVKTRRNNNFGIPVKAVNSLKQKKIRNIAKHYLNSGEFSNYLVRFDVIGISINGKKAKLRHLKNVF